METIKSGDLSIQMETRSPDHDNARINGILDKSFRSDLIFLLCSNHFGDQNDFKI